MSLARQFFREFRPLFRMLEEPFGPGGRYGPTLLHNTPGSAAAAFRDPFFSLPFSNGGVPAVDVSEEPNAFVVEAELPGVKRENVDVRIGDNGQSLTIEGRTFIRSRQPGVNEQTEGQTQAQEGQAVQTATNEGAVNGMCTSPPPSYRLVQYLTYSSLSGPTTSTTTQLTSERSFTGESSFSRTIWLPRRVDGTGVSAKLEDGILTIRIPKAEDRESVRINVQ